MEHVTGETLQARLRRVPLSPKEALEIAGEVAEALEAAHKRRVVHRDLKPSNVMLTDEGHVKVMDFGLAKQAPSSSASQVDAETVGALTESGVRIGTPGYMSPEQLLGGQVDERSDVFAFGILLYELLAGVHPFTRASQSGTMSAILPGDAGAGQSVRQGRPGGGEDHDRPAPGQGAAAAVPVVRGGADGPAPVSPGRLGDDCDSAAGAGRDDVHRRAHALRRAGGGTGGGAAHARSGRSGTGLAPAAGR